jgi:diguanylate cyclase (GGDEF)-like protein
MQIDGLTLMVAGGFVATLAGVLVTVAWAQTRGTTALLWWGVGHLLNAVATIVLAAGMTATIPLAVILGAAGIVISMTLYWWGVRAFFHRRPSPLLAVAAMAIWTAVTFATLPAGPRSSVAVAFFATSIFLCLSSLELSQASEERLSARWGLMAVFLLHASFMAVGAFGLGLGNFEIIATPSVLSWFGVILFERLIFLIGSSLFMVLLARERFERTWFVAASIDSLTGVANRSAFFARAERIYRRAHESASPVSLIAFDLDHFKAINDTHGHGVGDRVLRIFAETAVAMLRPADWFGRIGGEEFAAILPGAGSDVAVVVAERICHAFGSTPRVFGGIAVQPTVSAGVASATASRTLEGSLEEADRALYRAKALGRNRVERAAAEPARSAANARIGRVA